MKKITILLIGILLFPLQVFAYSNYVILGGESIGIHIDTRNLNTFKTQKSHKPR